VFADVANAHLVVRLSSWFPRHPGFKQVEQVHRFTTISNLLINSNVVQSMAEQGRWHLKHPVYTHVGPGRNKVRPIHDVTWQPPFLW